MMTLAGVGLSLVLAGCGGAAAGNSSGKPPTTARPAQVTPTIAVKAPQAPAPAPVKAREAPAQAPATAAKPANPDAGIPQGGGGDGDPDNAGGPNDGDGGI